MILHARVRSSVEQGLSLLWFACCLLAACGSEASERSYTDLGAPFVSAADAEAMRRAGALVLDARRPAEFRAGHVRGAVSAWWQAFVAGERSGLLLDEATLSAKLRARGLSNRRSVLVYGAWQEGWGEEGRIAWMLDYLGQPEVRIVAGGFGAWVAVGGPVGREPSSVPPGDFVPRARPELRATLADVQRAVTSRDVVVLDTRSGLEYAGVTLFGEARGGHLPGAVLLPFVDLFASDGSLRSAATLRRRFADAGVREGSEVVLYCTGGVRSGFFVEVLRALGLSGARNYDGSYWEWSARRDLKVER